jgi:phospholipid N-methyltransferase
MSSGSDPGRTPAPERRGFLKGWLLFIREAVCHPRSVGALIPSSPALAKRMAGEVPDLPGASVIELGAGTGVVTESLLKQGLPPSHLLAVERSPALAEMLQQKFPAIRVVCGDAGDLTEILQQAGVQGRRHDVVSSLPLKSLPADSVHRIRTAIGNVLAAGGIWIQFTYSLARAPAPPGFLLLRSSVVWANMPPARMDVFALQPLKGR